MKKEWLQEMKRFCEEESGVGVVEIKSRFLYTKYNF